MNFKQSLKLYNTETREKEEIAPLDGRVIRMYTCGPTVYNYAHIGNFRTYVFEDLLRRTLQFFGFKVNQAMNLTDVDDKTIKGAVDNDLTLGAYTQPFKEAFFEDLNTLNIEPVEHYPQATDYVEEMIAIIQKLLEKKVAYVGSDKSIYFSIQRFPSYGRLAHLGDMSALKAGASERVATDEYDKEHVSDFVLWKAYDIDRDGAVFWESPFGKGRPGWHIECSAMAMKILGESIDIHVGGVDNLFPHHENEIAQSEAYSCKRFVKHWLHAEHLLVDHKKMSKSLGNFYTLRDLLKKGYTGKEVRYLLLQVHYRTQLNFTFEALDAAKATIERLTDFLVRLQMIRHEKLHKALDLILEKALPNTHEKKTIRERILFDLQASKDRNILDADLLRPVLERSLAKSSEHVQTLHRILTEAKGERDKQRLRPFLQEVLHEEGITERVLTQIVHDISDEKGRDLLDPVLIKPLLARALQKEINTSIDIARIEHRLTVKKNHGYVLPLLTKTMGLFIEALADDINISLALGHIFEMVREVNTLCDQGKIGIAEAEDVIDFLHQMDRVLGVLSLPPSDQALPVALIEALERREQARLEKNWKVADECRTLIQSQGYVIEDTPQGARLKKK